MQKMGWFGAVRGHSRSWECHHSIQRIRLPIRFRDIAGYLSKVADFDPPHLHLAPPQGVTQVEFRGDLWRQKTRIPGLSCGVVCVILRLAILVEHRLVSDRQIDRQTDRHGHGHRPMASTADAQHRAV